MTRLPIVALLVGMACLVRTLEVFAQVPQPFPRPAAPRTVEPRPPTPEASAPAPTPAADAPTEATLGFPIYPTADFLQSFDAGRGQRYYLFGSDTSFTDMVAYYRTLLKQRGTVVFEAPPVHIFEVGRFREETMAFPPGVTIKDYTWNGSQGYLHVKPDAPPARYRTIIQIVPAPPGVAR